MTILSTKVIRAKDVATTDVNSIPEIPVFYPTMEEFQDFQKFIRKIEKRGAHHMGLCKIVPPKEWCSRKKGYSDLDLFIIPHPIEQSALGKNGVFMQVNESKKSINFQTFRRFDFNQNLITPKFDSYDQLENEYWKSVGYSSPLYGANIGGTITDEDLKIWNIAKLPSLLSETLKEPIGGVNTPYLYFGSWKSTFGWHVEDQELYSINYLHFGLPKFWYVIPPPYAKRFEALIKKLFPKEYKECSAFLRHKSVIVSPLYLRRHGIPTRKIIQEENDIMITFPYGYHSGFNTGLNIAESTNFATRRWIEYGQQAVPCKCFSNTVNLNMRLFSKYKKCDSTDEPNRHPLDYYEDVLTGKISTVNDIDCYGPDQSSDEDTDWVDSEDTLDITNKIKNKSEFSMTLRKTTASIEKVNQSINQEGLFERLGKSNFIETITKTEASENTEKSLKPSQLIKDSESIRTISDFLEPSKPIQMSEFKQPMRVVETNEPTKTEKELVTKIITDVSVEDPPITVISTTQSTNENASDISTNQSEAVDQSMNVEDLNGVMETDDINKTS